MELTNCGGSLSKPGCSNFGNNFNFIWIIVLFLLFCGDGFDFCSILKCFCGGKRRRHHRKKHCGCDNFLGDDNIFIILIIIALIFSGNNGNNTCCEC